MGNGTSGEERPEGEEPELRGEGRDLKLPAGTAFPVAVRAASAERRRSSESYAVAGYGGSSGSSPVPGQRAVAGVEPGATKQDAAKANSQGVELLRQGQHLEAVRLFQMALSQEPWSVQILSNIGLAYSKMQDFKSAYEWYERAYKEDTRDVEALFSLAWVERKRQRFNQAQDMFQKVLDIEPDHQKTLYLLGDVLKTMQDFAGATIHFERLVKLDPNCIDGFVSLGQCYEQGKQHSRAAQMYSHVLSLSPSRVDVVFSMGRTHYNSKQYRQSLSYFDRVSDTDQQGFDARTHAAKACRELEDHARAIANAERAAALWAHPDVMHFLGEECLRLGDERKAAKWFSRTIGADPNHLGSLLELGQLMARQGRWQEADSHFSRLRDLDHTNVVAIKNLALAKFKLQQFEICRHCCDDALRVEPLNVDALWLLAELRRTGGVIDEERWYTSLRTPPDVSVADICQTIAKGYLVRKQVKEAEVWLTEAKRYTPTDARLQEALDLLATHGNMVNPQSALDVLGARRHGKLSASSPSSTPSPPPSGRREALPEPPRKQDADASVAEARCSHEALERLLWRAERAGTVTVPGKGGGKGVVAAASEHWAELLACAKAALRLRPDDTLVSRCAARALLSTGGAEGEIRGFAAAASRGSEEGAASGLGYELHFFLARCAERDQLAAEAERHYSGALGSKPGDVEALLGLARLSECREGAEGRDRARRLYEQVAAAHPDNAEALVRLAEYALENGQDADAYKHALHASQVAAPSDLAALSAFGRACARTGRSEEAARALEHVVASRPADVSAMMELAALCRSAGREHEALAWFRRVLDLRPGDFTCNLSIAQVHAAKGAAGASQAVHFFRCALQSTPPPKPKESAEIYGQMAAVQIEIRAWKDAQQTLETAVSQLTDFSELWRHLLVVYRELQDSQGQQRCHRQLARTSGATVADRLAYAELLLAEGSLREARERFEKLLTDDPDNVQALVRLATCWRQDHTKEGHLEQARRLFERAAAAKPRSLEALEGVAYCHRKSNNVDQAVQLYQKCLEVKATAEGPLYYLGELLYRQNRLAECQHYLQRLVDSDCSAEYKIVSYYLLAKAHVSLDEYAEAEKQARAGLSVKPNHPHTLFILALVKNRTAEYDASIAHLKQALLHCEAEGDQLRVEIHDWLAQAYERKGDYALATAELDKALTKDPSHVSSLITRGFVHTQLKQLDEAEIAFRRVLAVENNHALALLRLGYCRLLASDHREASRLFQRAAEQRCGTVALPNAVKGSALIYLALTQMASQDMTGALARLAEAKKSHKNFAALSAQSKPTIMQMGCSSLVEKLRAIPDLDLTMPQAWQLVHLMAKELESDCREPAKFRALVQAALPVAAPSDSSAAAGTAEQRRWAAPAGSAPAASAPAAAGTATGDAAGTGGAAAVTLAGADRRTGAGAAATAAPTAIAAPPVAAERRRWTPGDTAAAPNPPEAPRAVAFGLGKGGLRLSPHEQIDFSDLQQKECLGQGGFGAVYRGMLRGREVAIKKLFCEDGGNISPLQLQELESEVAALRGLNHPRLVGFIAACLQPPNLCIITEFMPNGSLHHLLHKAKTPLTVGQQAKMALQVCEGVAFLHSQVPPVVHRDLKSLNIVLDHVYNTKICDFGLTQSMEKTHLSLKEGGNGGSPRYMAPECYDCKGKITEKVDVWALGCILVEIFGGPLPYDDCSNIQQIVAKVLIDKEIPYIPHHLPRGVRPIVEDCFHFDIKLRTTAQDTCSRLGQLGLAPPGT